MFHLPKQVIQLNRKTPTKEQMNHTDTKKITNINQIKQEIETILKRNNHSPFSLKQGQKSQKLLHPQKLQKKGSKVSIKAPQEYVQIAKDNRKLYEEFLFGSDIILQSKKSTHKSKQNLHTITTKERSYHKDASPYLIHTSKINFKSHRTISFSQNGKSPKSPFYIGENDRTAFEKILISTSNDLKFRKSNLLNTKRKSNQQNIFKDTAKNTLYEGHNFDFTRYLKSDQNLSYDTESKQIFILPKQQNSLEIVKKEIISKRSSPSQERTQKMTGFPKIKTKSKIEQSDQKCISMCHKKSQHYQVKATRQKRQPTLNSSLNVLDDQLLIYYGKLKNRRVGNQDNENNKKPHVNKIRPKDENLKAKQFIKNAKVGPNTSKELIKRVQIQSSWKTHRLDPWEKMRMNEDAEEESIFDNLEEKRFSQELSLPFQS